jgi:hypothetical protein
MPIREGRVANIQTERLVVPSLAVDLVLCLHVRLVGRLCRARGLGRFRGRSLFRGPVGSDRVRVLGGLCRRCVLGGLSEVFDSVLVQRMVVGAAVVDLLTWLFCYGVWLENG